MASTHPFGNDPAKIERYKAFWNRDPVDRPLVGFSFVGWYPLEYFSVSRSWSINDRISPDMLQPQQCGWPTTKGSSGKVKTPKTT